MSETREGAGDPNETTAVTKRSWWEINGKDVKIVFSLFLGTGLAVLALLAIASTNCGQRPTVETRVNQIAVDVAMLRAQMGLTTGRTSVLETRTDALNSRVGEVEGQATKFTEKGDDFIKKAEEFLEKVNKKANRSDLKKYDRVVERVESVEREVARINVAPSPDDLGAGTVTLQIKPVPANPDEE